MTPKSLARVETDVAQELGFYNPGLYVLTLVPKMVSSWMHLSSRKTTVSERGIS